MLNLGGFMLILGFAGGVALWVTRVVVFLELSVMVVDTLGCFWIWFDCLCLGCEFGFWVLV